jgi:IS30 family transposase
MKLLLLLSLTLASLSGPSLSAASIPQRENNIDRRIAQGVRNGSLSPREAVRLNAQSNAVSREIRRDRFDGPGFTAAERRDAHQDLNRLSHQINRAKRY